MILQCFLEYVLSVQFKFSQKKNSNSHRFFFSNGEILLWISCVSLSKVVLKRGPLFINASIESKRTETWFVCCITSLLHAKQISCYNMHYYYYENEKTIAQFGYFLFCFKSLSIVSNVCGMFNKCTMSATTFKSFIKQPQILHIPHNVDSSELKFTIFTNLIPNWNRGLRLHLVYCGTNPC